MRLIALIFLIGGVALAGGAIYYATEYFETREALLAGQRDQGPETVRVVAAKMPLKFGDRLTFELGRKVLKFVEWPKEAVPENAFFTAEELFGDERDESRVVTRAIEPGELLLKSKLTGFGESIRVATQVSEGMRAFTLPINAVTGGGGLIAPGDRVDILYVRKSGATMSSHMLMQNVLVVATDQTTDTERTTPGVARTATVEVHPNDAQRLTLAQQTGMLSLLLRGTQEATNNDSSVESIDLSQLPGGPIVENAPEPIAPVVEPEDTGYRVRVRKGAETQDIQFK